MSETLFALLRRDETLMILQTGAIIFLIAPLPSERRCERNLEDRITTPKSGDCWLEKFIGT